MPRCLALILLCLLCTGTLGVRAADDGRLRLVVLVVVDQLRGDALSRFGPALGQDGLLRLAREGVWYRNAHFSHAHTVTGPGHATLATGARPSGHGIVSNEWVVRSTGAKLNCVGDGASPLVGTAGETGNGSPANLFATTFADEWVMATGGRGRAFGISGKDRGAILPAGKMGKAFWYSTASGRMVSSTYYYRELPAWAADWCKKDPTHRFFKKTWERTTNDDDGVAVAADDRSIEKDIHGMKKTFPHPLGGGKEMEKPEGKFYEQIAHTVYGDELMMEFALEALRAEEIGQRGTLDILSVSLSCNDIIGHNFGPDSVEAKEALAGVDRQVARLLKALDEKVGAGKYLLALGADHGVAFSPEVVSDLKLPASRYETSDILKKINRKLNFSIRYLDWAVGFSSSGFYFDPDALVYGGKSPRELEEIVAELIRGSTGIAAAFTRSDILSGRLPDSDITRKVKNGYHPDRSPDVVYVPLPYWLEGTGTASHGTPYNYDTHVPLIFFGAGLTPGRVDRQVDTMDLAPTIARILGTNIPSASMGTPLPEVLGGVKASPLPLPARKKL